MKTELELLKMLRDYVADQKTDINGLCVAVINMNRLGDLSIDEANRLGRCLQKHLPLKSEFYSKDDSFIEQLYIWEVGDKQPRLEFLDKLIEEKASLI